MTCLRPKLGARRVGLGGRGNKERQKRMELGDRTGSIELRGGWKKESGRTGQ